MRVFAHVSLVFLLPSMLLGTISPVVAKMALDQGLATGRTVGSIYAWSAAGSIAGTFAAGYWLIAVMGSVAVIWVVAAVLLFMAIGYWSRLWIPYVWLLLLACALAMGTGPWDWAKETGAALALREKPDPEVFYTDESQYFHISVRRLSEAQDKRVFMQDKLAHSAIIMGRVTDLQYEYEQIHAAITHRLSAGKEKLSVLVIGGGGYVFPRYVETVWPGSQVDVVEIDPAVTEAAIKAFGLERDTSIRTFNMDARNYVDELIRQQHTSGQPVRYDFIYEDALNDYSVPFQLTTREFNEKIAGLLARDGVYMVNLIDVYDSGLFLGSYVNTLKQTFSNVYVISISGQRRSGRNTFVVVATQRELDLDNLHKDYAQTYLDLWYLSEKEVAELMYRSGVIVLTDDHAPVENLLAPVGCSDLEFLFREYIGLAEELAREGRFREILQSFEPVFRRRPAAATAVYAKTGVMLSRYGRISEAVECLNKAVQAAEQAKLTKDITHVYFNLGILLKRMGRLRAAQEQFSKTVAAYRWKAKLYPDSAVIRLGLGDALTASGNFKAASEVLAQAVTLNPNDPIIYIKLARTLELQGRLDEAMSVLQNGLQPAISREQVDVAAELEKYIDHLKRKKSDKK
jgi:spermidine synthase/Flp pilus assembly protein TadD